MGVRIIEDRESGEAVFACTTSQWAFGPIMRSADAAELFLKVLVKDPRDFRADQLEARHTGFVYKYQCECGNLRDESDAETRATYAHPKGCLCDDAGECDWCKAKAEYLDAGKGDGRFVCYRCAKKQKATA